MSCIDKMFNSTKEMGDIKAIFTKGGSKEMVFPMDEISAWSKWSGHVGEVAKIVVTLNHCCSCQAWNIVNSWWCYFSGHWLLEAVCLNEHWCRTCVQRNSWGVGMQLVKETLNFGGWKGRKQKLVGYGIVEYFFIPKWRNGRRAVREWRRWQALPPYPNCFPAWEIQ